MLSICFNWMHLDYQNEYSFDEELSELLDDYLESEYMKPTPCMGMNKMNCEQILRKDFFSMLDLVSALTRINSGDQNTSLRHRFKPS